MSFTSDASHPKTYTTLSETIDLLGTLLGAGIKQIYGQSTLNKVESLGLRCKEVKGDQELFEIKAALSHYNLLELKQLIHCFSIFFLLSNQAEQCEIIQIKRRRQALESIENPRAESIAEAIKILSKNNLTVKELKNLISELRVIPTITAHPTESRRRSVLIKQLKIAEVLFSFNKSDLGEVAKIDLLETLSANILGLLVTDDVRAKRLSVHDEVENGIFFLAGSILEIVPQIMRDIEKSSYNYFGFALDAPAILRYRSWIGGDRDGNPNVTAAITTDALSLHRTAIIEHYIKTIHEVRNELSVSTRKHRISKKIDESIAEDRARLALNSDKLIDDHQIFEPLREKCEAIALKLKATLKDALEYLEDDFYSDLKILEDSLAESNLLALSQYGTLKKLMDQVKVFGFSLADLDLRQHSKVHQTTLSEILRLMSICADYAALDEKDKIDKIHSLLKGKIDICKEELSSESKEVLAVFKLIDHLNLKKQSGLGAYVISMTHSVSDMLEPLLLWKLSGAKGTFPLDVVPLFETIEDLQGSNALLESIVSDSEYISHLNSRHNFQEVMLGYSDSNKDGGYASANVLLYEAQLQIAQVCHKHNIKFQIFHGRGGSVGRGGGRAGRAILASPPESHSGKVRFTEQGEVISFRYSMPELGHRHLEQIVSAVILSAGTKHPSLAESELEELKNIAEQARIKYRELIDAQGFWEWYVGTTPITFISSLPIASRPVMRAGTNLEFENLRAIPWVFSWTQTRYNVPSWYGLGTALEQSMRNDPSALKRFQLLYKHKVFFQSMIDNAQQEMARARLIVAKQYSAIPNQNFHDLIEEEFSKAQLVILQITGQAELLDNNPVIKKSIATRNPYTDALNLIQADLLRRAKESSDEATLSELREAIHMSISALAAAMQTTG